MARYQYTGPGPIEILSGGELIRPGDVREFSAEPDWGPWELLAGPDTDVPPADMPVTGTPVPPAETPPAPLSPLSPPITPKGM